jgi:hypothetical protein
VTFNVYLEILQQEALDQKIVKLIKEEKRKENKENN